MLSNWQLFVGVCAGLVTIITLLDKIGITGRVKQIKQNSENLNEITSSINDAVNAMKALAEQQEAQKGALLALIRNALYQSFRKNREVEAWTDDECMVQTRLHDAYIILGGNGEEAIWWKKKTEWNIVSDEDYKRLLKEAQEKQ